MSAGETSSPDWERVAAGGVIDGPGGPAGRNEGVFYRHIPISFGEVLPLHYLNRKDFEKPAAWAGLYAR